eukprot:11759_6
MIIHESGTTPQVNLLSAGKAHSLVAVGKPEGIAIISEICMHRKFKEKTAIYQLT